MRRINSVVFLLFLGFGMTAYAADRDQTKILKNHRHGSPRDVRKPNPANLDRSSRFQVSGQNGPSLVGLYHLLPASPRIYAGMGRKCCRGIRFAPTR